MTERSVRPKPVEALLLVGEDEKQQAAVPQQGASRVQPLDGTVDVFEDMAGDEYVERLAYHVRVVVRAAHVVHGNHRGGVCAVRARFGPKLFRRVVVEKLHLSLGRVDGRRAERPHLEDAAREAGVTIEHAAAKVSQVMKVLCGRGERIRLGSPGGHLRLGESHTLRLLIGVTHAGVGGGGGRRCPGSEPAVMIVLAGCRGCHRLAERARSRIELFLQPVDDAKVVLDHPGRLAESGMSPSLSSSSVTYAYPSRWKSPR